MDGRLAPLLRANPSPGAPISSSSTGRRAACPYKGVRSNEGRVYVEYTSGTSAGDKELYDIREDPYQLNNLMDDGPTCLSQERLAALKACSGMCVGRSGQQVLISKRGTFMSSSLAVGRR